MTKYLIFKNDPASGKLNAPGSPEQVACDIARAVALDADPPNAYIVYPAESPQATFEALKATPRFSIELDQGKIVPAAQTQAGTRRAIQRPLRLHGPSRVACRQCLLSVAV